VTFFSEELAMKPALKWMRTASLLAALLVMASAAWAQGAAPAAQAPANPGYTTAEYNDYNAAKNTADPAAKIRALEAFIAKYNNPTLMPFVYRELYTTYFAQKNYVKTIEFIDKLLALGDKVDAPTQLAALVQRGIAYGAGATDAALQTPEILTKTREASAQGLTALAALAKPANMADAAFENQKKAIGFVFNSAAGIAASYLKDYKAAATSFKAALVLNPNDATTHYRLGAAYLQDTPPMANDGFWELGRSMALNIPGGDQVKQFMRGRLIQYQQPGCEKLADDQINQVLTLSAAGGERPFDFNIPSMQELQMARDDTTNFLPWLQEGGAHGNIMWLATCGLEFPDVAVRVMELIPGDVPENTTFMVFRAPTQAEMEAATAPNMEVHIVGQPDARKILKDSLLRFTGTLNGYQPTPFLLTWDDARVNADDLADLTATTPGRGGRGGAGRGRGGAQ
jgi:tetratricopeptide (TPR) repeat protein